ncbi:MAG: DEAD/DEAH box helicase [Bacteroidetes bacterium]|nr:DEAD/DEAH box helicase [Bacteroidota bacterium]
MASILTTKGYSILKSRLTESQTREMHEELTVVPAMNAKFATKAVLAAATFKVYRESPTRWYVPRAWGQRVYGPPDESVVPEGLPLRELVFKGSPYDYQEAIMESFMKAGANGLICVPCGKGKTFMALGIASRIQKRFLIVVDKEFLMNQWKGEMEALLPGIRIGIVQGPKRETGLEYDATICMIQTICGQDIPESLFHGFGFTVFDECHHLGAQHFSKTLQRIQTQKMLGLSATPTREDGLTKVFTWYLGEPVYWEKTREPDPTVEVKSVVIETDDVTYNTVPTNWKGEPVMAQLLGNVIGCDERSREIVRWIRKLCEEPTRRVLVLSERIGLLERLEELIKADSALTIAYYIGGMKEAVREEGANTARILLGTYAMASEAMNIKTLNAVILASPRKAVEQSTGRILRIRPEQRHLPPVIVDIVDTHSMYQSQWRKRREYYEKCAYKIERWKMGADSGRIMASKKAAADPAAHCLITD